MNALLKYGLNFLVAVVFVGIAAFDCVKGSYGSMAMNLSIAFFNCFVLLFIQNGEKIDTLKDIEEELKQQHKAVEQHHHVGK